MEREERAKMQQSKSLRVNSTTKWGRQSLPPLGLWKMKKVTWEGIRGQWGGGSGGLGWGVRRRHGDLQGTAGGSSWPLEELVGSPHPGGYWRAWHLGWSEGTTAARRTGRWREDPTSWPGTSCYLNQCHGRALLARAFR